MFNRNYRYLIVLLLCLLPSFAFGGGYVINSFGTFGGAGGGGSCTGPYGFDSTPAGTSDFTVSGSMYLQKITLDCTASAGDWFLYTQYTDQDIEEYIPVIYDSNGDLVWEGTPAFGPSASPQWVSQSFTSLSLTAGDYYIGFQNEVFGTKMNRVSNAGDDILIYTGTFGTIPASVNLAAPSSTVSDYNFDSYITF